jgi:hypothetical protein
MLPLNKAIIKQVWLSCGVVGLSQPKFALAV